VHEACATQEAKDGMDRTPQQTLYVRNLTEKLNKEKLRRQLYNLFTRFGPILDVAVQPGQRNRGQAWVVFADVESATKAKSTLSNYVFFAKPMDIQFAAARSDVVTRLEGTYVPREKKPREERPAKKARADQPAGAPLPTSAQLEAERQAQAAASRDANNPPGPIIKVDGFGDDVTQALIDSIMAQYAGHKETRFIAGKGVAFVEFFTTGQATTALQGLRGFALTPAYKMRINYAKQG